MIVLTDGTLVMLVFFSTVPFAKRRGVLVGASCQKYASWRLDVNTYKIPSLCLAIKIIITREFTLTPIKKNLDQNVLLNTNLILQFDGSEMSNKIKKKKENG